MFPVELTSRKQWLLWSFEQYEGDKNHAKYRITLTVKTSRHTRKPEDLAHLATYEQAKTL